ncbi:MAG: hypothetical protein PSV16_13215 [Flavobacterium sp.]|nr:hypothetical protein [Flavobacterium sp.]
MKKMYVIFLMLSCIKISAQMSDTFTSLEYNENVSTQNNTTKINLFNIDFNGEKFPVNLIYTHKGIMINETPNSLGINWQLQNIGKISETLNDEADSKDTGWFNTPNPDYTSSEALETINCTVTPGQGGTWINCPAVGGSYYGNDLAPDFFTFNSSNGLNFDFLYKKNIIGSNTVGPPIPVILSNFKDFKINTNFSNFLSIDNQYWTQDDIVFDIVDTDGTKYDFINGPDNPDVNRSFNGDHRNDFYVASITNPSMTSEMLNITYRTTLVEKKVYYSTGYSQCPGGLGSNSCDVIHNRTLDYFTISENRFDIEQIVTNNCKINFVYHSDYLEEIEITDLYGNYITGYFFDYVSNPNNNFLKKIEKFNNDKTERQTLFEFDYYDTDLGIDFSNADLLSRDYFGYFNNTFTQTNLFPLQADGLPAADLNPNLTFAQYFSLKKITNKYGGTKEFGYKLKTDVCAACQGDVTYGGGLITDYVITNSDESRPQYIKYDYDDLDGNVVNFTNFKGHYAKFLENVDFIWSSRLELYNTQHWFDQQMYPIQKVGNFYKKITESVYDFQTMNLLSKIYREYEPNPEGIYLTPQLKKELFYNDANTVVKENEYFYSNSIVETIESASYTCDTRNLYPSMYAIKKLSIKNPMPIQVNRSQLIEKIENLNINSSSITNQTYFNYVDPYSNLIRSRKEFSSNGTSNEERYYYPNDPEVAGEPNINILQLNNRVGSPIKSESYYGTEKIGETKTLFGIDASTSNLFQPKYLYAKKGKDSDSTLEKKLTYNSYDDKGNITQYTQENGVPISMIWGYNKTKLLAKIENISYSAIPVSLITAAQNASDIPNNEANILNALDAIRIDNSLTNSMVTTYTHIPLIGVSTITDPKGDKVVYKYDKYGKLIETRDKDNYILSETDYNYKLQN